jgi:hypothetical protein
MEAVPSWCSRGGCRTRPVTKSPLAAESPPVCKPPPVESTDATETGSGVVTDVVVVVVAVPAAPRFLVEERQQR